MFQSQAEEKGLTWELINNIPSTLYFKGDQVRFEQVMINLCSNALKFTKQGSILITFDATTLDAATTRIIVRVKDSGVGISVTDQKKLFTAFTQADDSTSREFGGTGLGLALSREISHLMQGDITIDSEEGKGAEFIFQCDIATSKEVPLSVLKTLEQKVIATTESQLLVGTADDANIFYNKESDAVGDRAGKKIEVKDLRILVAEDNEINQLVIEAILNNLGVKAVIVDNGLKAVERIQIEEFDVILMDCQMPVLDGYKATEQIRKIERFKDFPIFALTADVTDESKRKAKEVGFTAHLSKPILVENLLEALESI